MNHFFAQLKSFSDFHSVANKDIFTELPDDWWIAICDVAGSTKAIEAGLYKDVNTLGAATIIAALNASKGTALPFVFGGDGATIAYPDSLREPIENALSAARKMASDEFSMDLRVGVFKSQFIKSKGFELKVAKFRLSPQVSLAMFRGDGFKQAELLLKDPSTRLTYEIEKASSVDPQIFAGLECRWNPIQPKHDIILSMIVSGNSSEVITQVLTKIESILGENSAPISKTQIPLSWPPQFLGSEVKVRTAGAGHFKRIIYWLTGFATSLIGFVVMSRQGKIGNFDAKKYMHELVANSDHRKFDDSLRMIVDCTNAQASALENYLDQARARGELSFGVYRSPTALMTCMVFSWDHHVHFIDGSDGGYALAAKQLKSQLFSDSSKKRG